MKVMLKISTTILLAAACGSAGASQTVPAKQPAQVFEVANTSTPVVDEVIEPGATAGEIEELEDRYDRLLERVPGLEAQHAYRDRRTVAVVPSFRLFVPSRVETVEECVSAVTKAFGGEERINSQGWSVEAGCKDYLTLVKFPLEMQYVFSAMRLSTVIEDTSRNTRTSRYVGRNERAIDQLCQKHRDVFCY